MGRPALGPRVKEKTIAVRVTEEEKKELAEKYGSPTKALRALINADKRVGK